MKTLKSLFETKKSYIIELPINKNYYLFIEGLTEWGEALTGEPFNVNNIKSLCIELFSSDGEYLKTVSNRNISLKTTIEALKETAIPPKAINTNDITKAQSLKQGESLISDKYIITCQEPLKSYIIEFYEAKNKWFF